MKKHILLLLFALFFSFQYATAQKLTAEQVIEISKSFGIDAQIVGRVEECDHKELIIRSEFGEFVY